MGLQGLKLYDRDQLIKLGIPEESLIKIYSVKIEKKGDLSVSDVLVKQVCQAKLVLDSKLPIAEILGRCFVINGHKGQPAKVTLTFADKQSSVVYIFTPSLDAKHQEKNEKS